MPLAMYRVTDDESVMIFLGRRADVKNGTHLDHRGRREWLEDCRSVHDDKPWGYGPVRVLD
jgi:hypothetical protein